MTRTPPDNYDERLLHKLNALVDAQARRPAMQRGRFGLRPRIATGAAALAVAGAVAIGLAVSPSAAYAVEPQADGSVRVEIRDYRDADQLEKDLKGAGINATVDYLPAGKKCADGRFTSSRHGGSLTVAAKTNGDKLDFTAKGVTDDETLVISTRTDSNGGRNIDVALAAGNVKPCKAVDSKPGGGDRHDSGHDDTGSQDGGETD